MQDLIAGVFLPELGNPALDALDDSVVLRGMGKSLAYTTDAFVVHPLFFPGGDIGRLAVCGTVNDLAAVGAVPKYMGAGFVLEEGFPISDLRRIVRSIRETADEAGVAVAAGDTKVVERGRGDGVFIHASGIGFLPGEKSVSGSGAKPGDAVLVNGSLGRHGMAVVTSRVDLGFDTRIQSDVAPLGGLVRSVMDAVPNVHAMRDATRGGLAAVLNEIARQSGAAVEIDEALLPVDDDVRVACDLLGFDPLEVANEGVMVFFVQESDADAALAAMRHHRYGTSATRIGTAVKEPPGRVFLRTRIGSRRIVGAPSGELLPRIC